MSNQKENLSRRDLLKRGVFGGAGLGAVLAGGAGCSEVRQGAAKLTGSTPAVWETLPADEKAVSLALHVLGRAGFGHRPGEINRVVSMGAGGWLEEQLAVGDSKSPITPDDFKTLGHSTGKLKENPAAVWRVNALDVHEIEQDDPNELYCQDDGQLVRETGQAAILRATYSAFQLHEMMADFWTNHFNLYALKGENRSLLPTDTERVIRPHALGSFKEMLVASAHSPAMMTYLDNKENKNGVANENYAREILELHTLGVNSGYTQKDIQEVARCFTGWGVGGTMKRSDFEYRASLHDEGVKYIPFLDLHITPNGGQKDADSVLSALANHPVTAKFLATKLCRRFLGDTPPDLIQKAADAYLRADSKVSILALLRPILLDGLLNQERCKPIVKRPLDFAVSALRALDADTDGGEAILGHLSSMGQPLYQWPMPDGFPEKASAWTSVLLPRWKFALALASNGIAGTKVDLEPLFKARNATTDDARMKVLSEAIFGRDLRSPDLASLKSQMQAHLLRAAENGATSITTSAELAALMLSAPIFQSKA